MQNLTRFHEERALRAAGHVMNPYPTAQAFRPLANVDQLAADRQFLAAGDAWDNAIDSAYRQLLTTLPPFEVSLDSRDFAERCEKFGIAGGLTAISARVPHRYTSLYQLDDGILRNIEFFDKAGKRCGPTTWLRCQSMTASASSPCVMASSKLATRLRTIASTDTHTKGRRLPITGCLSWRDRASCSVTLPLRHASADYQR